MLKLVAKISKHFVALLITWDLLYYFDDLKLYFQICVCIQLNFYFNKVILFARARACVCVCVCVCVYTNIYHVKNINDI